MIDEIERWMRNKGVVAVNMHRDGDFFSVHVRHSMTEGFVCSQRRHVCLETAVREHLSTSFDLSDLLV